ncbi:MAG TPA: tetratricopeptide repeat protein [Bryobacteraceae bacterium]|nr:tetratricopeptide repeat protein [Bryobacteraceae bacterium]
MAVLAWTVRVKRPQANRRNRPSFSEEKTAPHSNRDLWICLALLAAIFLVYGQTAGHDFLNYDDPDYVTDAHVRGGLSPSGLAWAFTSGYASNSFPFTWISHMLDFQLFGGRSGPSHLVNVALHAISALLLFLFLRRVTGTSWRSAFVAWAFALHPLHLESVAWIAERKDVLSTLFWMLTLCAYARYAERRSVGRYALVAAMFCCGLLSKPMIVTFPFAALLLDEWPLRRFQSQPTRRLILEKVPLVALSLCASAVAYIAQSRQGVVNALDQVPLAVRAGNAFVSYVLYLRDFVWPANLAVFYPYIERPVGQMIAAALAITAATALAARNIRLRPYIAVGWFWYLGTLTPVIGLIQVGSQSRADRYTYIPLIGIAIIAAWGAVELFDQRGWNRRLLASCAAGICVAWAAITWSDAAYWRNSSTLFTHALAVTDANYVAYNNLGAALRHDGNILEAIDNFERVVAIRPDDPEAQDNLGEALTAAGKIGDAEPHLVQAVRLRPSFAKAHVDLGAVLFREGHAAEAESQYRIAVEFDPSDAAAQFGLGGVLMAQGREQEAQARLERALPLLSAQVAMNPEDVDGHYNLGTIYGILGRADDAIAEFSQAIRLRPGDAQARFNLGTALAARNRLNEAQAQFAEAVRLVPDYAAAHFNLARVLEALGRREDAVREYRETLRLNPENREARQQLEAIVGSSAR